MKLFINWIVDIFSKAGINVWLHNIILILKQYLQMYYLDMII